MVPGSASGLADAGKKLIARYPKHKTKIGMPNKYSLRLRIKSSFLRGIELNWLKGTLRIKNLVEVINLIANPTLSL